MSPVRRGLFIALLLAALALPSAAHAAYPGQNGNVAFVSGQHIMVQTPTGIVDLTGATSKYLDSQPKFSPDGRRIVFVRGGNGLANSEIWVMNADGSGAKALTSTPTGNGDPTWSPDGSQIAFVSGRSSPAQIFEMNADGSGVHQITHDTASKNHLAWSPKGDRILFVHEPAGGGDKDIYSMKPDGSGMVDLTNDTTHFQDNPAWSPDGTRIVYTGAGHPGESVGADLWTMNADGSNQQPLHHQTTYSDGDYAAWSPDGTTIAFGANNGSGYYHLWSVPAGGGQNTELVANKVPGGNPVDQQTDWQPRPGTTPAPSGPVAEKSGSGSTVTGTVRFKVRGGQYVALSGTQTIPVGSLVDATHGTVRLTVIGPDGKPQSGDFGGGVFLFTQKRLKSGHKRLLTTLLTMKDGSFSACKARAAGLTFADTARRRVVRYLNAKAHGRFAVIGKYSTGLERGTQWKTSDTCDGTLTSVQQGTVYVTDRVRHRTIKVRAHHSYLARPKAHHRKRRR